MADELIKTEPEETVFIYNPAVFVVGREYQIIFITAENGMAWVECGGEKYTDSVCGVVRSETNVHRIHIPTEKLDAAGEYTAAYAKIPDRVPYFPKSDPAHKRTYKFRPYDETDGAQIYMLADTHSHGTAPARAASYFGDKLDLLILNGDIGNSAKDLKNMMTIHRIASIVCKGERPVVFARGNHDTRGKAAEVLPDYTGNDAGKTYFTFRLKNLWGIVLDCGEDKSDPHAEYGDIADYMPFRRQQTEFIKNVIKHADEEYNAEGVEQRIAICHIPFMQIVHDFCDDIYDEWTTLLGEIGIDVMLTGHRHKIIFTEKGKQVAEKVAPDFPVIVGARMNDDPFDMSIKNNPAEFTATAVEIIDGKYDIKFTNSRGAVVDQYKF